MARQSSPGRPKRQHPRSRPIAPPQAYARIKGPFLPKFPILTQRPLREVPEKRLDGRIISQAISIKLVFGVGIGLVIGAILPFVFGKASRPSPVG